MKSHEIMDKLVDYIMTHTERGTCVCGQCIDVPEHSERQQPEGHTADLIFFKVSARHNPHAETLRHLIQEHQGAYADIDVFDGTEHSYLDIGAWIGDQGLAMQLMGLGSLLGLWEVITPRTLFRQGIDDAMAIHLAQRGMLWVRPPK